MRLHFLPLLTLAGIFVSGCATIGRDSNAQAILVRSNPPGATISVNGRDAGRTPRYVLLERKRRLSLDLKLGDEKKRVDVETKYRWGESFGKNFVFLVYAPIGWGIDLISGSAWRAEDTPVIDLGSASSRTSEPSNRPSSQTLNEPRTLAIAPPIAETINLSDTGGSALERELANSSYRVKPYKETLSTFIENGYDFDSAPEGDARKMLYYRLGVDAIYESKIEPKDGLLVLTGQAVDTITRETDAPTALDFEPSGEIEHLYSGRGVFQFLPNTIAVDLVSEKLAWTQGNETIELVPARNEEWWSKGIRYISALNITNLPARRPGRSSRGVFNFVPLFRLSRRDVVATGAPDIEGREYVRWFISAGYGLEAGWQISRHFLYLRLIPQVYWNRIIWENGGGKTSRDGTGINFVSELGYLFFLDSHWNMRIFTRTANEDSRNWEAALSRTSSEARPSNAGLDTVGISIGYRFEPAIQDQRWRSPSKNRRE